MYDRKVLSLDPVLYLPLGNPLAGVQPDLSGHGHAAAYQPRHDLPGLTRLPNGDRAAHFDGAGQYAEVQSSPALSIPQTGCLTVEAWVRPAVLQFPREQGTGYAYILGKGTDGKQEYALRMYSLHNSEAPARPNRVSAYVFNLAGGEGSGAYFQDRVQAGRWMMVAFSVDARPTAGWPDGFVAIYKNGRLRGKASLSQFHVRPGAANAPFRIATRDLHSYFDGAVAKVAVYGYVLPRREIQATYNAMVGHR